MVSEPTAARICRCDGLRCALGGQALQRIVWPASLQCLFFRKLVQMAAHLARNVAVQRLIENVNEEVCKILTSALLKEARRSPSLPVFDLESLDASNDRRDKRDANSI